jgi:hypothetical protein
MSDEPRKHDPPATGLTESTLNRNGSEAGDDGTVSGFSFIITEAQKVKLRQLGHKDAAIREMKPEDAHEILRRASNGNGSSPSVRTAGSEYLQMDWRPMRLMPRSKKPALETHEASTITWDNLNTLVDGDNIAIRFKENGNLKDVDLDWETASKLALAIRLPNKTAAFSRPSAGVGHLLYNSPGLKSRKFNLPDVENYPKPLPRHDGITSRCVLEIRGGSDNTYTMFPPSIHPETNETLSWLSDRREPAEIESAKVVGYFGQHAFASAVLYFYPTDASARYETRMALSNILVRSGMSEEKAASYVQQVAKLGGDPKWEEDFVGLTKERLQDGKKLFGIPTLIQVLRLPEACEKTFREWLQIGKENDAGPLPEWTPLAFKYSELQATPWVARGFALRGAVTYLAAAGGTGKTQFTLQAAIAFALGEDFAGYHPMRPIKIVFVSGEEPIEELHRRMAAIVTSRVGDKQTDIDEFMSRLDGRLFTYAGKNVALVRTQLNDKGGMDIVSTPFQVKLRTEVKDNSIDLVILDPVARLHIGLDENSSEMQELHNRVDDIATWAHCGVVLVHHIRKSSKGIIDDQHAARGASAMTDAARIVIMMANMTSDEADLYLPEEERKDFMRYCKIADPKQNYSLNSAAKWFHKASVELPVLLEDNSKDCRMVLKKWRPDPSRVILDAPWLQEFFDKIEAGLGEGEFYTTSITGLREKRGDALIETYGVPKGRPSRAALALLVEMGMLGIAKKRSPSGDREVDVYTLLRRTVEDLQF